MKTSAVIFDLDGTILVDEEVYADAFRAVLGTLGKQVSDERPQVGGVGVDRNWPILIERYGIKTEKNYEELGLQTQREFLSRLGDVNLRKGFRKLVDELREKDIRIGLATSNNWWVVEQIFDKFGIEDLFDSVVTIEEVTNSKPSPDLFLATADKLGVNPEECVVFEDSQSGVEAAMVAGMHIVLVGVDDDSDFGGVDRSISDFTQISVDELSG